MVEISREDLEKIRKEYEEKFLKMGFKLTNAYINNNNEMIVGYVKFGEKDIISVAIIKNKNGEEYANLSYNIHKEFKDYEHISIDEMFRLLEELNKKIDKVWGE